MRSFFMKIQICLLFFSTSGHGDVMPPAKIPVAKADRHKECPKDYAKQGTNGNICGWNPLHQCTAHCGPGEDIMEANAEKCGTYTDCYGPTAFCQSHPHKNYRKKCPGKPIREWREEHTCGSKENERLCFTRKCIYPNTCKVGVKYPCCRSPHHPADKSSPKTCKDDRFGVVTKSCLLFTNAQIIDYIRDTKTELPWATEMIIYARTNYSRYAEDKRAMGCLIKGYINTEVEADVIAKIKSLYKRQYKEPYDPAAFDCETFKVKPVPKACENDEAPACDHILEYNDNLLWFTAHKAFIPKLIKDLNSRSPRDKRDAVHRNSITDLQGAVKASMQAATQSFSEGQ